MTTPEETTTVVTTTVVTTTIMTTPEDYNHDNSRKQLKS